MALVRALGAAWAASLGLGEVDASVPSLGPDVMAWLSTIGAATDFEATDLVAKADSERTSTVARWLLDRTRSRLASANGPIDWDEIGAQGQMLLRIVERGHGTDFPGGQLAEAHARLLMGLGGQLRRSTAQDDYLQAERQYLGHHDAALAALARLGAAASDQIRVAITGSLGLQPDFSSLATAAEQARAASRIDLTRELDGFERTLRCIAAIRAGAPGQANYEPAQFAGDPEAAQLFETAAFANLDNLPAGLRLGRLATDVYGLQSVTVNVVAAAGRALVRQRRWPDALTVLEECHRQDPRDPEIAGPLAQAYQELGQLDSARTMLVGMLGNPPTTEDLWVLQFLQNLAFLRNDPELEHWQGLIAQLDPTRTLAGQIPAPTPAARANPEAILAVFHDGSLSIDRRLLDLPEQERTAHMTAAIIVGSPDGAQQLSDLMTSDPALAQRVAQLLGVTLLSARQQRAAAHIDAGEALFQTRDFAAASAEYAAALEEDPDNARALLFLGDVNYRQGQYDLAQAYFEESIAIAPDPQAYRFLGDSIVQAGGSKDHGRLCYREALRMAPGYGGARVALQQLDKADDQGGGPSGAASQPEPVVMQLDAEAEQVAAPAALRWSPARAPVRRQASRQAMQMFAGLDDTAASVVSSAQASSRGASLPRDDLPKVTSAPPRLPDEAPAGGFADRLVRQSIDMHGPDSFVAVVDDDEAFSRWLAAASPDSIAAAVMIASSIAYHYEVKDRNLPRWEHWTRRQVQLAEALPPDYGPGSNSPGLGRHRLLAIASSNWADVLYAQGHLAEARDWYERAIDLMDAEREARERNGLLGEAEYDQMFSSTDPQAAMLVRLANICRDLGDAAAATGYWARARELDRKRPTSETQVDQFIGAGDYAMDNGDMNGALRCFHQAWELAERLAATAVVPRALAKALNALGRCHHRMRLQHSARAYFERTRQLNEAVGNADRLTWDYREIARIYRERPDLGDARLALSHRSATPAAVVTPAARSAGLPAMGPGTRSRPRTGPGTRCSSSAACSRIAVIWPRPRHSSAWQPPWLMWSGRQRSMTRSESRSPTSGSLRSPP